MTTLPERAARAPPTETLYTTLNPLYWLGLGVDYGVIRDVSVLASLRTLRQRPQSQS